VHQLLSPSPPLIFTGLQAQTPHVKERRREGDTLYVQCPYTDKTNRQWKGWCHMKNERCHEYLVFSDYTYMGKSKDGRSTISDNPKARTVSVTMAGLKAEDSGTYSCIQDDYSPLKTISLNVFKGECHFGISPLTLGVLQGPSSTQPRSQAMSLSNVNTFMLLSVVLSILLLAALLTSVSLYVRLHKLLGRTGMCSSCPALCQTICPLQLGSTGRRESSQDGSRGLKYKNRDLQSQPSPGDPLYCNIDPSQAPRNPRDENVEYAVIAFNQFPRNDTG
ncbi:TRML2 protein, partial [Calyptomena viridis]|nr:TRML2 protein [Calyptomena viridis]